MRGLSTEIYHHGESKTWENNQWNQFLNLRVLTDSEYGEPWRLAAVFSCSQDYNEQCTITTLFRPLQLFSSIKHLLSWRVGTTFEHKSLIFKRQINFLKSMKLLASHTNSTYELVVVIWTFSLDTCVLNQGGKKKKKKEEEQKLCATSVSLTSWLFSSLFAGPW